MALHSAMIRSRWRSRVQDESASSAAPLMMASRRFSSDGLMSSSVTVSGFTTIKFWEKKTFVWLGFCRSLFYLSFLLRIQTQMYYAFLASAVHSEDYIAIIVQLDDKSFVFRSLGSTVRQSWIQILPFPLTRVPCFFMSPLRLQSCNIPVVYSLKLSELYKHLAR